MLAADSDAVLESGGITPAGRGSARLQPIGGQDLIDEVEAILRGEVTEQVVVDVNLAESGWPTGLPDFGRPENCRLRNGVALPDLEHALVILEVARVLYTDETSVSVDEPASAHDDVASAGWIVERLFGLHTPVDAVVNELAHHAGWMAGALLLVSLVCRRNMSADAMANRSGAFRTGGQIRTQDLST